MCPGVRRSETDLSIGGGGGGGGGGGSPKIIKIKWE